ncbi:Zinc finger C2H2 [Penicillium cf. griseofulvum]|uniref:Zinc finger C2H2 n=1 Tax=Penicillium cf. griseofulvum TaxID=2972120 RepID=A0A9W9IWW4_9EURO|nr:Zinc finger C2H2 [Penicillium cf. griseofulvum]KAJ5429304.1 Zinc finger C2H2 [Penicillium cf. griseofulvum]
MRTKHDPTLKYMANIVDFGEHSNNEILRTVLPRTEFSYSDKLLIFDHFVKLHPLAVIPPDIRTCRAFLEWVARGMTGRIEETPTVETI